MSYSIDIINVGGKTPQIVLKFDDIYQEHTVRFNLPDAKRLAGKIKTWIRVAQTRYGPKKYSSMHCDVCCDVRVVVKCTNKFAQHRQVSELSCGHTKIIPIVDTRA